MREATSIVENDELTSKPDCYIEYDRIDSKGFASDWMSKLVFKDIVCSIISCIKSLAILNISPDTLTVLTWEIVGFCVYTPTWAALGLNFNYSNWGIEFVLVPFCEIWSCSPTIRTVEDAVWSRIVVSIKLCLWWRWDNRSLGTSRN